MALNFKSKIRSTALKAIEWLNFEGVGFFGSGGNTGADRAKYSMEIGDALRTSIVMAAVKWLGRLIHEAPMHVVIRDLDGRKVSRTARHEILALLKKPNEYYSGKTLMKALGTSWMLDGNAYAIKRRDPDSLKVTELWYEPHFTIRERHPSDGLSSPNRVPESAPSGPGSEWISFYEVWRNKWVRVERDDVLHVQDGMDPSNPRKGINGLSALIAEVYTDLQRAHFSATVLSNVGMIPFVVSPRETGQHISEKQADKLKMELESRSRSDRGKPIVAGRAIRIDELGFSPADMDLKSLASIPEQRVAAVLGPNLYVLGFASEQTTFSTYVEAREAAFEEYLIPLHKIFAEEFTSQLLAEIVELETPATTISLEYDFSSVSAMQAQRDLLFLRWGRAFRDGVATRYTALIETGQPAEESDKVFAQEIPRLSSETITSSGGKSESSNPNNLTTKLPGAKLTDTDGNDRPRPGRDKGPILGGKQRPNE